MAQGFLILEKTTRRNGAKNVYKKDKTKAVKLRSFNLLLAFYCSLTFLLCLYKKFKQAHKCPGKHTVPIFVEEGTVCIQYSCRGIS
jgi:hypothetical protein